MITTFVTKSGSVYTIGAGNAWLSDGTKVAVSHHTPAEVGKRVLILHSFDKRTGNGKQLLTSVVVRVITEGDLT
jgi:predicted thioesterase